MLEANVCKEKVKVHLHNHFLRNTAIKDSLLQIQPASLHMNYARICNDQDRSSPYLGWCISWTSHIF